MWSEKWLKSKSKPSKEREGAGETAFNFSSRAFMNCMGLLSMIKIQVFIFYLLRKIRIKFSKLFL